MISKKSFKHIQTPGRSLIIGSILITICTLTIFHQVVTYDFVIYDDPVYVTENRSVQNGISWTTIKWAFTTTHGSNWHPLTWLSHQLDCQFFGLHAGWHHAVNVVFHTLNAILLFICLHRMTGRVWRSLLVGILFAVHPLHVESVAWIAERKDVLSGFFWMLAILSYVFYVEKPGKIRYLMVFFSLVAGLLAKPMVITLPFALILLDYWPLNRFQSETSSSAKHDKTKSVLLRFIIREKDKIPLIILSLLSLWVTISVENIRSFEVYPLLVRGSNVFISYVMYLGKMIWPRNLVCFYPHPREIQPLLTLGAITILTTISVLTFLYSKKKPWSIVGWLWYLGTLLPVIGLIQIGSQGMADRYTYIPLIGIFLVIVWMLPEIGAHLQYGHLVSRTVAIVLILVLMMISFNQVSSWADSILLFKRAVNINPNNYLAHNNLGVALTETGKLREAHEHYLEAIRIKPDYAEAYNNLGNFQAQQGNTAQAIKYFTTALKLFPNFEKAHNNLGNAYLSQGRIHDAIVHYAQALHIKPDYFEAHNNIGGAYLSLKQYDKAIHHYREALLIDTHQVEVYNNLGAAFMHLKKGNLAIQNFRKALHLNPNCYDVHSNMATTLIDEGNFEEALKHYQKAQLLRPGSAEPLLNLARLYLMNGEYKKSIHFLKKNIALQPHDVDSYYLIASLYARQNIQEEAFIWLEKAIEMGFDNLQLIETDKNLDSLRDTPRFHALVGN